MKVLLIAKVNSLGNKGDIKEVSEGYAKNFLIPQKLAVSASGNEVVKAKQKIIKEKNQKKKNAINADELINKLKGVVLTFSEKADVNNNFFAGITKDKIAKALVAKGVYVKAKNIILDEAIKTVGEYKIKFKANNQESSFKLIANKK